MNPAMVGALMGAGKGIAQGDDIKGIAKKAAIGGVTGFAGGQGLSALGSTSPAVTPVAEIATNANIPTLLQSTGVDAAGQIASSSARAITPNFADKALNFATTAPDNLANYVSDGFADMSFADKLTLGLTGASAIPDDSQQLMPVQNSMVARGGPYQPNLLETNVPGMQTAQRELTDEEKLLLMQQNNSLLG